MSKREYVNLGRFEFPVTSVPFAGAFYVCVEGSKRHDALNRANHAFNMGYRDLAEELKQEALQAPGCAFELREKSKKLEDRDGYHSELAAYRNLYN